MESPPRPRYIPGRCHALKHRGDTSTHCGNPARLYPVGWRCEADRPGAARPLNHPGDNMTTTTETSVCWRLVLPDGTDWDQGDGVPHFPSEKEAMERFSDEEILPGTKAVPFPTPCVTVACNECEADVGGDDVFTQIHCQDVADAHKIARASDWKVTTDGRTYCWGCPVPEGVTI